jgi:hypothetical protein
MYQKNHRTTTTLEAALVEVFPMKSNHNLKSAPGLVTREKVHRVQIKHTKAMRI